MYFSTKIKEQCYGCKACEQVCPQQCLSMVVDHEGFWYPEINTKNCTNCGLCEQVCPFSKENYHMNENIEPLVFAAWTKNEHVKRTSSSGGMFSEISDYILNNSGTIFGAVLDKNLKVLHISATTKEEREYQKGSKYVQSDINTTYVQAKKLLEKGELVMFSGTPCQIGGLYSFLGKNYDNLTTVDIVCHGVPSPKIFRIYIDYLERKYRSTVSSINFRDKDFGWNTQTMNVYFENEKSYISHRDNDIYYRMFLYHLVLRPSCHNCQYTKTNRQSDITIADFWGIGKLDIKLFEENKGVSLVILNTEKGKMIFENIKKNINSKEFKLEQALQPNLIKPSMPHPKRKEFWDEVDKVPLEKLIKKYWKRPTLLRKIRNKIMYELKILFGLTKRELK
ncbi:MAG: Coenzyme F420 hydrogenase/dehydrogenase, beta subunit C-terminal domain [Candidatus Delongbacteria bacterium]|nr:Coenzyme F420 hydrogenase/dehydrogenase, beta subunit C-terminal domain [Candidatus Delongbacteria bacterium]